MTPNELQDGGKTVISCSSCGKPLIEVWIIQSKFPMQSQVYAQCPYCGDHSFIQKFKGKICLGHLENTVIIDMEEELFSKNEDGFIIQKVKVIVEGENE